MNYKTLTKVFFVNFNDEIFSNSVKAKCEHWMKQILVPVEKNVFEKLLFPDPFYSKLENEVVEIKLDDQTSKQITD